MIKKIKQIIIKNNVLRRLIVPVHTNLNNLVNGVKRLIVYYEKQDVMFLIVPKNANSSMNALFLEKNNVKFDKNDYKDIHLKREPFMTTTENLKLFNRFMKGLSFAFVRNPFDRLVSFYKNKLVEEREYSFERYPFLINHDLTFNQFINRLMWIPDILSDNHFISQYAILYDKDKRLVDYIGYYEHLKKDFEPIKELYGLKPLPHFNVANNDDWKDYYNLKTAKKVYIRYKNDFDMWYPNAYNELVEYINSKNEAENEKNI